MAVGQQPNNEPFDQIFLADDDFVDFIEQRLDECAGLLHLRIDGADAGIHFFAMIMTDGQVHQQMRSEKVNGTILASDCLRRWWNSVARFLKMPMLNLLFCPL